jgi:hypothetical protein
MATATATPPSSTSTAARVVESIIAAYKTHEEAEAAVRKLEKDGVPIEHVSIIGHDFKIREEIDGLLCYGIAGRDRAPAFHSRKHRPG